MIARTLAAVVVAIGVMSVGAPLRAQTTGTDSSAAQGVPRFIPYSGQILTTAGEPRTGNVLLTFGLYKDQTGGIADWTEQHVATLDSQGRYTVVLGTVNPDGLPVTVFAEGKARWLGLQVEAGAEQPRIMLVSVPYALKAADAGTLDGHPVTSFLRVDPADSSCSPPCGDGSVTKAAGDPGHVGVQQTINDNLIVTGNLMVNGVYGGNPHPTISGGTTIIVPSSVGPGQGLQVITSGLPNGSNGLLIDAPVGWSGNYFKANLAGVETFRIASNGAAVFAPLSATPSQGMQISLAGLANGSNAFFADAPAGWSGRIFKSNLNGVEKWAISHDGSVWFTGNVGIGTPAPTKLLHVAGDAQIDGNIAAKYQDVAEWVETTEPLEAGTLVMVDPRKPNHVAKTNKRYDTRVAGAVSTKPGLILGEKADNKAMIAQSGRVKVKVDARYGAVRIGDLLVTSPTPGYAMRSRPINVAGQSIHRPGTLVGKALEALPGGKGEILVLLTLQ